MAQTSFAVEVLGPRQAARIMVRVAYMYHEAEEHSRGAVVGTEHDAGSTKLKRMMQQYTQQNYSVLPPVQRP